MSTATEQTPPAKPTPTADELAASSKEMVAGMFDGFDPNLESGGKSIINRMAEVEISKKVEQDKIEDAKDKAAAEKKEDKPADPEKPAEEPAAPVVEPETEGGLVSKRGRKKKTEQEEEETPVEPAPLDPDAIADRVEERLAERQQQAPAVEDDSLNDEERAILAAVQVLQGEPKHKGRDLVKATKDFWKKEQDYIAAWEKENAGEDYDPEDKAHAKFYKQHQPAYTEDELVGAKERVKEAQIEQRARQAARAEIEPELREYKFEKELTRVLPQIRVNQNMAVSELVAEISPEFAKLLADGDKGLKVIDADLVKKLEEIDPVAVDFLQDEALDLRVRIEELEKVARLSAYVPLDPDLEVKGQNGVIRPHYEILKIGQELEQKVSQLPKNQQISEGKQFITRREMRQKVEAIWNTKGLSDEARNTRIEALKARHWMVELEDVKGVFIKQSAGNVRRQKERVEKAVNKRKSVSEQKTETKVSTEAGPGTDNIGQSKEPTTVSSSDIVNTAIPGSNRNTAGDVNIANGMW